MTSMISAGEARALAQEAYVFGFPLVYISVQSDRNTAVTKPTGPIAPLGQWGHFRKLPDATDRTVVGMNLDVLLSFASVHLADGPWVVTIPDATDRFWNVMWLDAWNNVPFVTGSRTTGGVGGSYAIVGPTWAGALPDGVVEARCPTSLCLLGVRYRIEDPDDTAAVNALQDQLRLVPLDAYGTDWQPPAEVPLRPGIDAVTPVPTQVLGMTSEQFFSRLNALLVDNPAAPDDAPTLERLSALGVGPGLTLEWDALASDVRSAIDEGTAAGLEQIRTTPIGADLNGWMVTHEMGRFGTNYPLRAAWTLTGVGGNLIEDACYPAARVDGDGATLDGRHRYRVRFPSQPPVESFWSIYVYDAQGFLIENPLGRCMLGSRSPLEYGDDGSLTLAIQCDAPTDTPVSNWLPAPTVGPFVVGMRLYTPTAEVIDGTWTPPPIQRIDR